MARGFLSGAILGGIVSLAGAGTMSVLSDPPDTPEAETSVSTTAPAPAPAPEEKNAKAGLRDADLVTEEAASKAPAPESEGASQAESAGHDTAPVPETGEATELAAAQSPTANAEVETSDAEPVLPSPQAALPAAPRTEADVSISSNPSQPPQPLLDERAGTDGVQAGVAAQDVAIIAEEQSDTLPNASDAPGQAILPQADTVATVDAISPAPVQSEEAVQPEQGEVAVSNSQLTPEPAQPSEDVSADANVTGLTQAADDEAVETGPSIGRPAVSLISRTEDAAAEAEEVTEAVVALPDEGGVPAIEAFAASFEDPGDKPLMSIVLLDEGADLSGDTIGLEALQSFPYPLSFAVDISLPDARDRMDAFRGKGFEVLALMNLPTSASAADAEVNLGVALDTIPEAVALIEGTGTGVQDSREAADQLIAALRVSGHGLVLQAKGLNTIHKLAVRDGLPAALVFRDFDSAGQTPAVIRRFLDQAAFRARQEGGVVMMGRLRPDTISALLVWGLQDRAGQVSLAPVSVVLKKRAEAG